MGLRGPRMSEARVLAIATTRHCSHCGSQLVRREGEQVDNWLRRRNCNRKCGMGGRPPRIARTDAPVVTRNSLPARDRCWAGFVVGRRCVLDRGSHVTHRDEAGHEFVRIERRPVERVERGASVSSLDEQLSMRSAWRSARQT